MAWSTQDLSWHREGWQWWKKNTCWAHSATAQECCVRDTMCSLSEYQKSFPLQEWKFTALDARTSTFQDKSNLTLMGLTSGLVSLIFSSSSSRNFCLRVQLNLCQKFMASKSSAWEAQSTSSNLTIRVSLSTKMKSEKFWNEGWQTPRARFWSALVPQQALNLSRTTQRCTIRAQTCPTRWVRTRFPKHITLRRT